MLVRFVMIILIFALIGFIWGKMRPLEANVVYLDLVPSYRAHIMNEVQKGKGRVPSVEISSMGTRDFSKNSNDGTQTTLPNSTTLPIDSSLERERAENLKDSPLGDQSQDQNNKKAPQKPQEKKKASEEKSKNPNGIFQKLIRWIGGLFSDSKEKEQIKKDALSSLDEFQEPISFKDRSKALPAASTREVKPAPAPLKTLPTEEKKENPQKNNSGEKQKELLKDVDISRFLLNTDVIPKDKK